MESFDIVKYKAVLLEVFKAFISICKHYNLHYYCAGGTALGAVRHHGFIPWDDDIDVLMPRNDYEKLISLNSEISKTSYSIISAQNTRKFATFAKFYNKNTTLWEFKEIPFVYGVYIDIFPLDEFPDDLDLFYHKYIKLRNIQRFYQLSQMRFSLDDIIHYYKIKDMRFFYKGLLSFFFPNFLSNHFRLQYLKVEKSFTHQKGNHVVCSCGEYYKKEYFEKKWFEGWEELPFEGLIVRVPRMYDAYLSFVFGDYMKLPPKEKQVSHHYHYFLDLNKGMTMEDVEVILSKRNTNNLPKV